MTKRQQRNIRWSVIPIIMVMMLALSGCFGPTKVTTVEVDTKEMPVKISNDANITALNKVTIEPTVSGQVSTMAVKVGDEVKQGQVVAMLDTSTLQTQLNQLIQELGEQQSHAGVQAVPQETTVVPGAVSSADVNRAHEMMMNGIITEKEYQTIVQRSQATVVTSGGGYVATGGGMEVAGIQAAIAQLQTQIAQSQIVAPMTGRVAAIYNEDRKVAIEGRPFMLIQQNTPVVASLSIPQSFALKLAEPANKSTLKVYLKVDDKEIPGELTYVDTNAPAGTPSVLVKATFNNTDDVIKPGEFYTLVIESSATAPVIAVPKEAVHENKDGKFVYVVTADNTVDVRVVETSETVDGYTAIVMGLSKGERIITSKGNFELGEQVTY
ncbi:efflux RND transporter periplasmic adaptor subunit [Veillonella criceti]|uniref:Multidrug resistance protein mexA n=1 Tax=Veillonella criceti TaxID=103891 RepID=A0A380NLK6_9FIRM|nr:efflux RND transporter periplasmic adaptor subunit [Veillonella criceti]SUP43216.1 Multidrug resistance protein mexA precursor [Veillonella criceti]